MNRIFKKIIAMVLTFTMIVSGSVAAFAAEDPDSTIEDKVGSLVTYTNNGYTFEKISHAELGTGTNDGWVDYFEYVDDEGNFNNGVIEHTYTSSDLAALKAEYPDIDWDKVGIDDLIGDGCQSYAYAAIAYGDWIYLGSMYGGIGIALSSAKAVISDPELAEAAMDFLYNDEYYVEHTNSVTGATQATQGILIKMNVITGEVKVIMSGTKTGECPTMRGACEYNGYLYFLGAVLNENDTLAGADGMPSIYELNPETDEIHCIYQATDAAGYASMVAKGVFPTLRTIIDYNGSLIASVTDENGARLISFTPTENDFDENGKFVGIYTSNSVVIRNPRFKVIAEQKTELFDYPAYLKVDSNYGGTIYQVIEFNGDLYVAINTGRATLGTAKEVVYDETTGTYVTTDEDTKCYRGWALVQGHYDETLGSVSDKAAWTWTSIIGNTDDDQWEGSDGALYTFNVDPERYAPGTCTLQVYNGYLYIGDYNDVTLSTFGALYGLGKTPYCFRHLATNLKQSINLYRLDSDMNVELVVGDTTAMFPEGSITGLGSGYTKRNPDGTIDYSWGSHSNQYTAKAIVYDNDPTDDNDGTMFFSTLDESTILTPIAQLMNKELISMDESEWMLKVERLRALIELYDQSTQASILSLMQLQSLSADDLDTEEVECLLGCVFTEEDLAAIRDIYDSFVNQIVSGTVSLVSNYISYVHMLVLRQIQTGLEKLHNLLETTDQTEFAACYTELYNLYTSIRDYLPESVTETMDEILNEDTCIELQDVMTILEYMKDATRGCDVYAIKTSSDGNEVSITCVTNNGMGDSNNHTMRNFAITTDYLVFCTGNPVRGSQIWRMAVDDDGNVYGKDFTAQKQENLDAMAAKKVIGLIGEIGIVELTDQSKELIDTARAGYDALNDNAKSKVGDAWLKVLTVAEEDYAALLADDELNTSKANEVIKKIDAIGTVVLTESCKGLIDDARTAYNALTDVQKQKISEEKYKVLTDAEAAYAKLVADKEAADTAAANKVIEEINAIGTVELSVACKNKIQTARTDYTNLTDVQKAKIAANQLKVLTDAEAEYARLVAIDDADKAAADEVVKKINAIGDVVYTAESKALIDDARAAYNALTEAQKLKISDEQYKVLTDAEARYASFGDQVKDVIVKINAIGRVTYTDSCNARINSAWISYSALSDVQKSGIPAETLQVLTDAITRYSELKSGSATVQSDEKAAEMVVYKINAIGLVRYTPECRALITDARNSYVALTSVQRAMITASEYKVLTDAEATYAELEADALDKVNVDVMAMEPADGLNADLSETNGTLITAPVPQAPHANNTLWIVAVAASVAVLCGSVVFVVISKKKKAE